MKPILDKFVYYLSYDEQWIKAAFEVSDHISIVKVYPAFFNKDFSSNPVLGCGHW